jgi:hypothetical protein
MAEIDSLPVQEVPNETPKKEETPKETLKKEEDPLFFKDLNSLVNGSWAAVNYTTEEVDQLSVFVLRLVGSDYLPIKNKDEPFDSRYSEVMKCVATEILLGLKPATVFIYGGRLAVIYNPLEEDLIATMNSTMPKRQRSTATQTLSRLCGFSSARLQYHLAARYSSDAQKKPLPICYFDGEAFHCSDVDALYKTVYSMHLVSIRQSVISAFNTYVYKKLDQKTLKKIMNDPEFTGLMAEHLSKDGNQWESLSDNDRFGTVLKATGSQQVLSFVLNMHEHRNNPKAVETAKKLLTTLNPEEL